MKIIKSLIFFTAYFFLSLIASFIIIFLSRFGLDKICYKIFKLWGKFIFKLSGSTYEFFGLEKLDKNELYVFCPNHTSSFDIYLLSAYLPFKFSWISKIEYLKLPIIGKAMRSLNFIGIDRTNPKKAFATIKKAVEIMNQKKMSVVIFPEGTRSRDGKLQEFKRGSLMLAVEAQKKIVPVTIIGNYEIQPKNSFWINKSNVRVYFSDPIDPPQKNKESQLAVLQKIYNEIKQQIDKYSNIKN